MSDIIPSTQYFDIMSEICGMLYSTRPYFNLPHPFSNIICPYLNYTNFEVNINTYIVCMCINMYQFPNYSVSSVIILK